jgi:acyl-CoA dehydrogenase
MQTTLSEADEAFRCEARAFLAQSLAGDIGEAAARQTGVFAEPGLARRWHQVLYRQGWIAPAWPMEHGGCGWSLVRRYIWDLECAQAGAPQLPAMGLQMCGPVLMRFGTEAQQRRFLPGILSGDDYWCQGYSEPEAGSDLASLQMRAVRDGDSYVLSGSKLWTTHAHAANWIFVLARTTEGGKPQAGISFLLCPMDAPGVSVTPIVSISGDHEVNQVFFDQVRVPVGLRVGEENQGWTIAKYLLEHERGGGSQAARVFAVLRQVQAIVLATPELTEDAGFRSRLTRLEIEAETVAALERQLVAAASSGASVGDAAASMIKLQGTEAQQNATGLLVEAIGVYGAVDQREAIRGAGNAPPPGGEAAVTPMAKYLNARAATIFGGASEVQRNILARVALGL